jgi:transposase
MLAYLANWAKVLSWEEVARRFDVCWRNVWEAVTYVVDWGLHERSLEGIEAIGVDEIHVGPKAKFLTLVYQLDEGRRRLLYVAKDRTKAALRGFFKELPAHVAKEIRFVCSDMWRNYLDVIKEEIGHAVHVLDRFHICARLSKAIDKVRASESRALARKGYEPVLKHTRFCYLKRPRNLTQKQRTRLKDVLQYDLRTNRAYLLKEAFQGLWKYRSVVWARWFLRKWCACAMRSKLDPIKEFVKTLRAHEGLLLNWVKAKGEVHGSPLPS